MQRIWSLKYYGCYEGIMKRLLFGNVMARLSYDDLAGSFHICDELLLLIRSVKS